ncbi:MAG TPA: hypothetical protein K8U79_03860 [Clostridium perfringens]|nr:hypothetical protein [Clostridium perfringens]
MDRMLLLQNILEALVFVVSTILFAVLYGLIDKKIRLTDKIFGALKIEPKWEWIIHIVIALILIVLVHYFGVYIFKIWNLLTVFITGAIAGICIYNINRNNF